MSTNFSSCSKASKNGISHFHTYIFLVRGGGGYSRGGGYFTLRALGWAVIRGGGHLFEGGWLCEKKR